MKTKDLIKFMECVVMDWDGWDDEQQKKFVAIIKTLQDYEQLLENIEDEKDPWR